MQNKLYSQTYRRGLFDFHAGEAVPEVELNVSDYFAAAAKSGMQTITFMTKDAFGTSYYDTKIGFKNSKLKGDLLAEAIQEARKHGIAIIAYYNVALNSHVAAANPDYRQRTADGQPITEAFGYYDPLCMNSPYRDFVFGQLEEIAINYEVAGFFFDITYVWKDCCYCEYCQNGYRQRFGSMMPANPQPGTGAYREWQTFQRDIRRHFLRDAANRLKSLNPQLLIGWNHAGDPRFGQVEADRYADYFTSEFHPPHYLHGSLLARWKRSFGKPFELMMPSEMGSWGEWTVAPAATLRTTAAIAVANGGSISFGHVAYPSGEFRGQLPGPVMEAIGAANRWVQTLEPWLADAESEPFVAVLHSIENKRMLEGSAMAWSRDDAWLQGLHRILVEGNIHFDIVDETVLMESIDRYAVVILPDQAYISKALEERIRAYVRNGGRIVASNRTSLYNGDGVRQADFGLADVFGVEFVDVSVYSVSYLYPFDEAVAASVPDMPLLLNDPELTAIRVTPKAEAIVLTGLMDPAVEAKPHRHVYHQHAHPARQTPHPGVVVHAYGKGACLYMSGPIESAFWHTGSPWLRKLYLQSLRVLHPRPEIEVKAPLSVEVNVMRQSSRLIVHLINVREDKAAGSKTFIEEIMPVHHIEVVLRVPAVRACLVPEGVELPIIQEEDSVRFVVPEVGLHAAVAVELSS